MDEKIRIDNTVIFEAKDKISQLVWECYKAGVNYGFAIARLENKDTTLEE